MYNLHIKRDAEWSAPGRLAALSSRSAERSGLLGCSCLEIILTCSGQINRRDFSPAYFFFFSPLQQQEDKHQTSCLELPHGECYLAGRN